MSLKLNLLPKRPSVPYSWINAMYTINSSRTIAYPFYILLIKILVLSPGADPGYTLLGLPSYKDVALDR